MKELAAVNSVNMGGQFHSSVLSMIMDAGLLVQLVLLILLIFSVVSWAIIATKYRNLRKINSENSLFLEAYMKCSNLADVFPEAKKYASSTLAAVFRAGYSELISIAKAARGPASSRGQEDPFVSGPELKGLDNVERALNRACGAETTKLEAALGFLATTGSASPFIGLFGTVWGIMDTFRSIGYRGSATLAVVAPGISEALIATAAGLAAAIPAVIFYNYYLNRVKNMTLEMDSFASELINIVERYYVKN
ncbi:Cell division and transport-associated protein TolQ [Syntrophus gentianae]|uniref:Cell division and transport-associated protein TolQ n=1 Tax=Syntrophus gentianae TaxID=43775 RepID=A0A1H7YNV7_9BACT|nr:protein TolQ [Syntrophus gentianae]SEM46987.1 Cell division and transport-associated protein TolQ [Syntrophus gentianae]